MKTPAKLDVTLPSDLEIVIRRDFDAPRTLVFDAMTKPELIQRWLFGPEGWSMPVCEVDLRVGGAIRYVWRGTGGEDMGMRGEFREIVRPSRLVYAELYDNGEFGGEVLVTVVLHETQGRTTLTMTLRCVSREARDEVLATATMDGGMATVYNRLETILASIMAGEV